MISPRVRSKVHPRVLVRAHALQAEDLWPDEKPFTELKSSLINLHLRLDTWETCLACTSDLPSVIWMSSAGKAAYPASSMDSRRLNQPEQIAAVLKVYWTGVGGITLLAGSHKCHKYQKYVYIYTYIHISTLIHNARICSLEAPKRYNKHKQSDCLCRCSNQDMMRWRYTQRLR